MKTKAFFFMVCIWLLTTNGFAQNTIKGDGNIITKEIPYPIMMRSHM